MSDATILDWLGLRIASRKLLLNPRRKRPFDLLQESETEPVQAESPRIDRVSDANPDSTGHIFGLEGHDRSGEFCPVHVLLGSDLREEEWGVSGCGQYPISLNREGSTEYLVNCSLGRIVQKLRSGPESTIKQKRFRFHLSRAQQETTSIVIFNSPLSVK